MYCPYCSHHVWDRDPGTCPSCGKPLPAIFPDPEASPLASWPDFAALVKIACWAQADIAFGLDFRLFAVQTEWLDQSGDRGALLRLLDYHALGVDQSLDYLSLRRALEALAKIADFMVDLMWCPCADVEEAAKTAAKFSSLRDAGFAEVDYTRVKHVKKPHGSKPGKAVYVNYKTVAVRNYREPRE